MNSEPETPAAQAGNGTAPPNDANAAEDEFDLGAEPIPAPNGEDLPSPAAAASSPLNGDLAGLYVSDPITAPNLDNRASVLTELPKGLYVEGRTKFAVPEGKSLRPVFFGRPNASEWVMTHPDMDRCRVLYCLKENARKLHPVLTHVLELHPKLKEAARQYLVRQAKVYNGDFFMWPVPWFDGEDVIGDQAQRDAHFSAKDDWKKLVWRGSDYETVPTEDPHAFDPPNWETAEDFEQALKRAVMPLLVQDLDHPYVKSFLGRR
jgi:hypothetical protein